MSQSIIEEIKNYHPNGVICLKGFSKRSHRSLPDR